MNIVNIERGVTVRRALLAVARVAHAQNKPLPTIPTIAAAIGICPEQCRRHVARLIHEGALVVLRAGPRRRHVQEIRL